MKRLALAVLASALLAGCGGESDGAPGGGGSGGSGGAPLVAVAPSSFDCSSLGATLERISTMTLACATDPACTGQFVSGHRGAGGQMGKLAPEDTLAAYRAAIVIGADFGETDPRPTADEVLVNVHDTTVDRVTDGSGQVDQMTLAEVQALKLRTDDFAGDFGCERIPTFREVLETCRGLIHVLVDANKTDRVDLLVGDVVAADALDWAIFDTSSLSKIQEALALEPSLMVMPRVSSMAELDAVTTALADHPPVIIEVNGGNVAALSDAIHQRGFRVLHDVFGQDVVVSTTGDLAPYGEPYDQGVDIAQTDRPELVLHYLGRL